MSTHLGRVRHALIAVAVFLLTCGTAAAQTISGVVTDASGGVLPGVTVEARNLANQQARTVTTDGAGRYVIATSRSRSLSRRLCCLRSLTTRGTI